MTAVAVYAQRLAALPRALGILELHPQGLPLTEVASELGLAPTALREVFTAYYLADLVDLGDFSLPVVEFFAPGHAHRGGLDSLDHDDPDGPYQDDDHDGIEPGSWVRVLEPDPEHRLGVDHLSAGQLAALYEAGVDLLALEPRNDMLRSALESFEVALEPSDKPVAAEWGADIAQALHSAAQAHRRVRVTYVRQWSPGASERVIEPYRLVRTRRGWEVDAGPPDHVAAVRTYLVSGITSHEVLDDTFTPPSDLDPVLAVNRRAERVELVVPQESRWAVERFAESTEVLQDDESDVALRAELLPPVEQRLGLLLLCCGQEAFVTGPTALAGAGEAMAAALLAHHREL